MTSATQVRELFIIERGDAHGWPISTTRARSSSSSPTPMTPMAFRRSATSLPLSTSAARTTSELRQTEREILASFLSGLRLRTLASDTFSWADDIPRLIKSGDWEAVGSSANADWPRHSRADAWPRWDDGLAYERAM